MAPRVTSSSTSTSASAAPTCPPPRRTTTTPAPTPAAPPSISRAPRQPSAPAIPEALRREDDEHLGVFATGAQVALRDPRVALHVVVARPRAAPRRQRHLAGTVGLLG